MGSAVRMGPGYFPFFLGILLALLGVVICIKSLLVAWRAHRVRRTCVPLLLVLGAIGVFAVSVEAPAS